MDWWGLYHAATAELGMPAPVVGSHTIPQLLSVFCEKPPFGADLGARDKESFLAMAARWQREHDAWHGKIEG